MKRPPARARSAPSRQDPPAPPREKKAPPRRGRTAPSSGSRTRPPSGNTRPAHGPGRASAADAAPRQAAAARPLSRTWKGPLPGRRLKFGQFLFFSGVIPARDLLDALSWQRSQRPAFGQIAREWGILDARQVAHVLVRKLPAEAFGECAARLGYMSPFEKHAVACRQKNLQRPLGRFFLDRGILDAAAMNNALLLQRAHNQAFLR